jgi:hypothetical protein
MTFNKNNCKNTMTREPEFSSQLKILLPATYELLKSSHLVIHKSVTGIILHGSRGIKGKARLESDIDLTLIVDAATLSAQPDCRTFLRHVSSVTLSHWRSQVELDLAIVFDTQDCGLKCFHRRTWDENLCSGGGVDCFGLYKIQKGFNGIVTDAGVQVKLMYPCLEIWNNSKSNSRA